MSTVMGNSANFKNEFLECREPVIVDFWEEWCGPCRAIAPTLEELSKELTNKVKITKLNIDDNADLATQYGIRSIPTLALFKEGKTISIKVGSHPKNDILNWILSNI